MKFQERDCIEMREKLVASDLDRERMRIKINKARTKLTKCANEKTMLEER